jgi:hypothetical protein
MASGCYSGRDRWVYVKMTLGLQDQKRYKYQVVEAILEVLASTNNNNNNHNNHINNNSINQFHPTRTITSPTSLTMSDYKPTGPPPILLLPTRLPHLTSIQSTAVSARTASPTSASAPAVSKPQTTQTKPLLTPFPEFAGGKVDPVEAGKKGGATGGETGGSSSGGSDNSGSSGKGQFAGGKVDPVEAGRKGGQSS